MKTIKREDAFKYDINPKDEPLITVKPGEEFKIETWATFEEDIFKMGNREYKAEELDRLQIWPYICNPVGGPVYIEGAEKGDALAVHIKDINPLEKGFTGTFGALGVLKNLAGWEECHGYYGHVIEHIPGPSGTYSDGKGRFVINNHEWIWDLDPHIGTLATAPERGSDNTLLTQGAWGGNLDCRDVAKGHTVFLNSWNEGGLLYAGDVHASQGDSELTGLADETPADLILSVDVIKNKYIPGIWRIEKPNSIVQVDSARNAGTAVMALNSCFVNMMSWLVEEYGYGKREAYLHMSINPDIRINVYQFVDGFFVCGVEVPRKYLTIKEV